MFHVFSRSWQGLNLSPGERAFVKLAEGWVFTATATGVAIAYQSLATGSHNYSNIALVAGGAAGLTVLNSVKKYLASQSDIPLPAPSLAGPLVEMPQVGPPPLPAPLFTTPVPQPPYAALPTISMPMAAMPQNMTIADQSQLYNMATQSVPAVQS